MCDRKYDREEEPEDRLQAERAEVRTIVEALLKQEPGRERLEYGQVVRIAEARGSE